VDLSEYQDYRDAYRQIKQFLEDLYMRKRIHSSAGIPDPGRVRESVVHSAGRTSSRSLRNGDFVSDFWGPLQNPATSATPLRAESKEARGMSPEDVHRFLDASRRSIYHPVFILSCYTPVCAGLKRLVSGGKTLT